MLLRVCSKEYPIYQEILAIYAQFKSSSMCTKDNGLIINNGENIRF